MESYIEATGNQRAEREDAEGYGKEMTSAKMFASYAISLGELSHAQALYFNWHGGICCQGPDVWGGGGIYLDKAIGLGLSWGRLVGVPPEVGEVFKI